MKSNTINIIINAYWSVLFTEYEHEEPADDNYYNERQSRSAVRPDLPQ